MMLNYHPVPLCSTLGNVATCSEFENETHSGRHTLACNPLLDSDLIVCDVALVFKKDVTSCSRSLTSVQCVVVHTCVWSLYECC